MSERPTAPGFLRVKTNCAFRAIGLCKTRVADVSHLSFFAFWPPLYFQVRFVGAFGLFLKVSKGTFPTQELYPRTMDLFIYSFTF